MFSILSFDNLPDYAFTEPIKKCVQSFILSHLCFYRLTDCSHNVYSTYNNPNRGAIHNILLELISTLC